jgi:hypothetical protein
MQHPEIPIPKPQAKLQCPSSKLSHVFWGITVWDLFGAWDLVLSLRALREQPADCIEPLLKQ